MLGFTAYGWLASTVCAAWFARRSHPDIDLLTSLVWQGSIYAAWLPAAGVVWLLIRRYGPGTIGSLALYLAGGLVIALEALTSSVIDAAFVGGHSLAARVVMRLPICLALYTAMVGFGLAAAQHREAREARAQARALETALGEARRALSRAMAALPAPPEARLIVMSGSRRVPVDVAEVEWFGAADNYVVVHWSDREGLLRSTLQALEGRLDPKLFARCHRSTLVNLARVKAATPLSDGSWRLTLESGAELVTSRTYRDELLRRLGL